MTDERGRTVAISFSVRFLPKKELFICHNMDKIFIDTSENFKVLLSCKEVASEPHGGLMLLPLGKAGSFLFSSNAPEVHKHPYSRHMQFL